MTDEELYHCLRDAVVYLAITDAPLRERLKSVAINLVMADADKMKELLGESYSAFFTWLRDLDKLPEDTLPDLALMITTLEGEIALTFEED